MNYTTSNYSDNKYQTWSANESQYSIINMNQYNDRIDRSKITNNNGMVDLPTYSDQIKMFEKVAIKNKSTDYNEALGGRLEESLLATVYFSKENIQIVQNGIRSGIYDMSGDKKIIIPPQNINELKIIMRSIYLQYALNNSHNITEQIVTLNNIVFKTILPTLYSECIAYLHYLRDQTTLAAPIELPKLNDRDYKQFEFPADLVSPSNNNTFISDNNNRTYNPNPYI
jgi:hypothetical protein